VRCTTVPIKRIASGMNGLTGWALCRSSKVMPRRCSVTLAASINMSWQALAGSSATPADGHACSRPFAAVVLRELPRTRSFLIVSVLGFWRGHAPGGNEIKPSLKDSIYLQRERLAQILHEPLAHLAEECAGAWGDRIRLNELLLEGFCRIPHRTFLYCLGTDGIQISDNVINFSMVWLGPTRVEVTSALSGNVLTSAMAGVRCSFAVVAGADGRRQGNSEQSGCHLPELGKLSLGYGLTSGWWQISLCGWGNPYSACPLCTSYNIWLFSFSTSEWFARGWAVVDVGHPDREVIR